jgi:intracellular sulfur oxidation DsrE/DsrF family protein
MTDHNENPARSRRQFMTAIAANAALLAAAGCARNTGVATAATPHTNGNGASAARKFDDSWTTRLGEHRVAFEVNQFNDAADFAGDLMDAYKEALGAGDKDMGFAVVLRHGVVTMVMRESVWQKYPIGEVLKYNDKEGKPFTANPHMKMVEKLLDRGVTFLACNVGLTGAANRIAKHINAEPAQVRADLIAALYPNVYVQPNGVYALLRAQNVGCAYWKLS